MACCAALALLFGGILAVKSRLWRQPQNTATARAWRLEIIKKSNPT